MSHPASAHDHRDGLVEIVAPYPFHLHHLARELAALGELRLLHTVYPARYVDTGVPRSLIRSRPPVAAARRAVERVTSSPGVHRLANRAVIADFDRATARRLRGAPVVLAGAGFGRATLEQARRSGATAICDRGSWHILEQQAVLEREGQRWGLPLGEIDPWIIERELAEYEAADRIFVPSARVIESFRRRGVADEKLVHLPYGVDLERYRPGPTDERRVGAVVSVATVGLQKGHQYLVPAYRRVRGPGTSLTLVGPVLPGMRDLLALGANDADIELTGQLSRPEVVEQLRRSSIFVLASVQEGLALVVAEAMSVGLAVIATEATGAADLITPGMDGLLVSDADDETLADALETLLADPERVRAMGDAARHRVSSLGGWAAYAQRALAACHQAKDGADR